MLEAMVLFVVLNTTTTPEVSITPQVEIVDFAGTGGEPEEDPDKKKKD